MTRWRNSSQDDLAYEAEISRSYLSQIEKGAVAIGVNDVHTEMMRRTGADNKLEAHMRKMKMRHYAAPPPRIISPEPSPAISPAATCQCAGPSLAER
jgi:transcriptional regulator with XRE-family HTH domain